MIHNDQSKMDGMIRSGKGRRKTSLLVRVESCWVVVDCEDGVT